MPGINNIIFFDSDGVDMNVSYDTIDARVLLDETSKIYKSVGKIFFPIISCGLIESQQLYILQKITGNVITSQRKIPGNVKITAGNPNVTGVGTMFNKLMPGQDIIIDDNNYIIEAIASPVSMNISPTPNKNANTDNIYKNDYLNYSALRSAPDTHKEFFHFKFKDEEQKNFFIYDIDYTSDVPYINKLYNETYELCDGSGDIIDKFSGRAIVNNIRTEPLQINLGFSSEDSGNFQTTILIENEKQYISDILDISIKEETIKIFIDNSKSYHIHNTSEFYIQGVKDDIIFYETDLVPILVNEHNDKISIEFKKKPVPNNINEIISQYRLLWKNKNLYSEFELYAEAEGEDERLKLVLENFGKKINLDSEYIFRDSDISENRIDYRILNEKRKELLLEGDNIYPYLGSYKALINIINFFGYYDLDIKEYFLNVNEQSSNYNKFKHVLVPRNDIQRKYSNAILNNIPSKIWKKTSYFGLFYKLNKESGNYDNDGIPIIEDSFMFSPEEVLIKLFGLKEILKDQFLPLNSRIIDITGEGIYFERIRINTWNDSLNNITVNLGQQCDFNVYPKESYISDLRRIDDFYKQKFIEQGHKGFLGSSSIFEGDIMLKNIYDTSIISYFNYENMISGDDSFDSYPKDDTWEYMPESVSDLNYNSISKRLNPLPDEENIIAGAPILLESVFDVTWAESSFSWEDLSILDSSGQQVNNIYIWTWDTIGLGQYIDCRWVVEKKDSMPFFYDSGRKPINDFIVSMKGDEKFSIPARIKITELSFGSISKIEIVNGGFGYTTPPDIKVLGSEDEAVLKAEITNGYVTKIDIIYGGSGYSLSYDSFNNKIYPSVIINPPEKIFEDKNRILHSVCLPYSGEYQIGMYLYDITNNFTAQFKKRIVKKKEIDFVSVYKKETSERAWREFENIKWSDISGSWYYPLHVKSTWEESNISWDSLEFNSYINQKLLFDTLECDILEINRHNEYVILSGRLDNLDDYLFFQRESSEVIYENIEILPDNVHIDNEYLYIKLDRYYNIKLYSRLLITTNPDFSTIDPLNDFYVYLDLIEYDNNILKFNNDENSQKIMLKNLSSGDNLNIYITCGLFSGTYAIEIIDRKYDGKNTVIRFNDENKELYYLDSNFIVTSSKYDVDYAEERIGLESLLFGNLTETLWKDLNNISWTGLEYHSGALCGFAIPKVAPGGMIKIDEFSSFQFSADETLKMGKHNSQDKIALEKATGELNKSNNNGIQKFNYTLMPNKEKILMGMTNKPVTIERFGSNLIILNEHPDYKLLKIPASLFVSLEGSSLNFTFGLEGNPGYGYEKVPVVYIPLPDDENGEQAFITFETFNSRLVISDFYGGSGYSRVPEIIIEFPEKYNELNKILWTGSEWAEIIKYDVSIKTLFFKKLNKRPKKGNTLLLPFKYHLQFLNTDLLNQFYYFIHAEAINPSSENLCSILMDYGIEGEWKEHPNRTFSYPLKNSILFGDSIGTDNLYDKWEYEGCNYPSKNEYPVHESDIKSIQNRMEFNQALNSSYSYDNTVISNKQQFVNVFTPVLFNYDMCRVPGKTNPKWTVIDDNLDKIEVISNSKNFFWNFTRRGSYTVKLELEDSNGNKYSGEKTSFIVTE